MAAMPFSSPSLYPVCIRGSYFHRDLERRLPILGSVLSGKTVLEPRLGQPHWAHRAQRSLFTLLLGRLTEEVLPEGKRAL
jgi:hypothetical protein